MTSHEPHSPVHTADGTATHPEGFGEHSDPAALLQVLKGFMGDLAHTMGIELTEANPGRVSATMPVAGNTQPFGLLHGGANAVLAETVGSIAAGINAGPQRIIFGTELSCTHHRSAREGHVIGTATALHIGRSVSCWDIVITDEDGRRLCTARLTCAVRDKR